jgi:hypothetical protein
MTSHNLAAACLIAFAALGCGGSDATERPAGGAAATQQPAVTTAATTPEFGVKECDDYVRQYTACVDTKAPEAVRAHMHRALENARTTWRTAAATAAGRQGLANACRQALESARAAMQMYGCEWEK